MTEYIVVNHFNLTSFQKEVERYLTAGFVLVGGVSAAFDQSKGCMYYFQAMEK